MHERNESWWPLPQEVPTDPSTAATLSGRAGATDDDDNAALATTTTTTATARNATVFDDDDTAAAAAALAGTSAASASYPSARYDRAASAADAVHTWLFNLADDPTETTNLVARHPDIAARLNATLAHHAARAAACMYCGDAGVEAEAVWADPQIGAGFVVPWVRDAHRMYTCAAHATCNA